MSDYENDFINEENPDDFSQETTIDHTAGVSYSGSDRAYSNKKRKLPLIAGLIILVAVLVGGGYFFYQKAFSNPFNQLLIGMNEFYTSREFSSVSEITFTIDENGKDGKKIFESWGESEMQSSNEQIFNFLSAVLPNFKIKYASSASTKSDNIKASVSLDLLYKDKSLVDILYAVKPWDVRIASKSLFEKPIYLDLNKLAYNLSGTVQLEKLHLSDYMDVLYEKDKFTEGFKDSKYMKIIKEEMGKKVVKEGNKIVLTLTNKENNDLAVKLLGVAKTDEALKKSVVDKVNKILTIMDEKQDYLALGLAKEQFGMMSSLVKVQVEKGFTDFLAELEKVYTSPEYLETLKNAEDIAIRYVFTMNGKKISELETSANLNGLLMKVVTKYSDSDAYIKEVEDKPVSDLVDLSNFQEDPFGSLGFITDAATRFNDNVLNGEGFKAMAEDFKTNAKEKLEAEDAAKILYFFDDVIPNLINNGLKSIMGG